MHFFVCQLSLVFFPGLGAPEMSNLNKKIYESVELVAQGVNSI